MIINKYCEYIDLFIEDIQKYQPDGKHISLFEVIKSKLINNVDFDYHDLEKINDITVEMLLNSSVQWHLLDCWKYLLNISDFLVSKVAYSYDVGIICSVKYGADKEYIEEYVATLEKENIRVFYPARDTNQEDETGGIRICRDNTRSFMDSHEIHIIFHPESQGTLFDLGICFNKPIHVVNPILKTENKSFKNVLLALEEEKKKYILFNVDFDKPIESR